MDKGRRDTIGLVSNALLTTGEINKLEGSMELEPIAVMDSSIVSDPENGNEVPTSGSEIMVDDAALLTTSEVIKLEGSREPGPIAVVNISIG